MNQPIKPPLILISRILLSVIFIQAGWGKLHNFSATQGFMESMAIPGILLPAVILLELGGGLAILLGFSTRIVSVGLALFSIASGTVFHFDPEVSGQMTHFYKNMAMAGGFFSLSLHAPTRWSFDHYLRQHSLIQSKNLHPLFS